MRAGDQLKELRARVGITTREVEEQSRKPGPRFDRNVSASVYGERRPAIREKVGQ